MDDIIRSGGKTRPERATVDSDRTCLSMSRERSLSEADLGPIGQGFSRDPEFFQHEFPHLIEIRCGGRPGTVGKPGIVSLSQRILEPVVYLGDVVVVFERAICQRSKRLGAAQLEAVAFLVFDLVVGKTTTKFVRQIRVERIQRDST